MLRRPLQVEGVIAAVVPLQISPLRLLALDRLKQRLEIALAKGAAALTLDDFVEQRRPVFHRLGEDLEHVALVIAVNKNAEFLQFIYRLIDLADALLQAAVIAMRHFQK